MKFLVIFALALSAPSPSSEYSMGAPDSACNRMEPGHGFDPGSGGPDAAPARLVVGGAEVAPGQPVKIRLEARDGGPGYFKGFIVQVGRIELVIS